MRPLKRSTIPFVLGVLRRGEAVFDAEVGAKKVEFVVTGGTALAQAEQAVGEFLAIACWE